MAGEYAFVVKDLRAGGEMVERRKLLERIVAQRNQPIAKSLARACARSGRGAAVGQSFFIM
jgi:hypothetical protein